MLAGEYQIVPENEGRQFAIYETCMGKRRFIARYLKQENAERHIKRLQEKWG